MNPLLHIKGVSARLESVGFLLHHPVLCGSCKHHPGVWAGWAGWWRAEEGEGLMELINLTFHDPIVRMTTVHFSCRAVPLGRLEPSAVDDSVG